LRECDYIALQNKRRFSGRPLGSEERYSEWRTTADPENLWLIDFYGDYLAGQFAGMGTALDLGAVMVAFRMAGVPEEEQDDLRRRLNYLHAEVVDREKDKQG